MQAGSGLLWNRFLRKYGAAIASSHALRLNGRAMRHAAASWGNGWRFSLLATGSTLCRLCPRMPRRRRSGRARKTGSTSRRRARVDRGELHLLVVERVRFERADAVRANRARRGGSPDQRAAGSNLNGMMMAALLIPVMLWLIRVLAAEGSNGGGGLRHIRDPPRVGFLGQSCLSARCRSFGPFLRDTLASAVSQEPFTTASLPPLARRPTEARIRRRHWWSTGGTRLGR